MIKSKFGSDLDARIQRLLPFLFRFRWNANAVSVGGALISLGAGVAFARGEFHLAAALVALGGLFDLVDGVIARHQGTATRFGAFLDSSLDRVADMAILLGLILHYAGSGRPVWAWVGAGALVATVLVSYTKARAESELPGFHGGLLERAERVVILLAGAIFGIMPLALIVVLVGSAITAGQRIVLAHRGLAALESEAAEPRDPGAGGDGAREDADGG